MRNAVSLFLLAALCASALPAFVHADDGNSTPSVSPSVEPGFPGLPDRPRGFGQELGEKLKENNQLMRDESRELREQEREKLKEMRQNAVNKTKEAMQKLKEERQNAVNKTKEAMQKLKEERQKMNEQLKEERQKMNEQLKEERQKMNEQLKEMRDKYREQAQKIREEVKEREDRLKELRAKLKLNDTEKQEYLLKARDFIQSSFDQRIATAMRLELEGADAQLVKEFVDYAKGEKAKFLNATTNDARRQIVAEFNAKWREFAKNAEKNILEKKLQKAVDAGKDALTRANDVISQLEARGYDTTKLEAISAEVAKRYELAAESKTIRQAAWRLGYAKRGLAHLHVAIQRMLNKQEAQDLRTEDEPKGLDQSPGVQPTATPSVSATPTATPTVEATATPTATPSVTATATPTETVTVTPSPSATASPTP